MSYSRFPLRIAMWCVLCAPGALWAAPGGVVELGAGAELRAVVDDLAASDEPARWGPMPTLSALAVVSLPPPSLGLRGELSFGASRGFLRLSGEDADGEPVDDRADASLRMLSLQVGPEVQVPLPDNSPLMPYVFWTGGGAWVRNTVEPGAGFQAQLPDGEIALSTLRPAAGFGLGATIELGKILAVDVEAGYTVCDVPAAALPRQDDEPRVFRTGYGLNQFGIGLSVRGVVNSADAAPNPTWLREARAPEEAAP